MVAAEAAVIAIVYLCGVWFGRTAGALTIFIICAVIYALGYKWTHPRVVNDDDSTNIEK